LSTLSINKKQSAIPFLERLPFSKDLESITPSPHNPIFKKTGRYGCVYCKTEKRGRKKCYTSLWELYYHLKKYHSDEKNWSNSVEVLADLLVRGVIL
jgi:hypothetical protein